jgi:haloalkane dehalogenase
MRENEAPTMTMWADSDPIIPPQVGRKFCEAIGRPEPQLIKDASHFLQEDAGERIGELIATWLRAGA